MRKTTIEVDDTPVERAQAVLGTRGPEDTVHRALEEVLALEARRRLIRQLQEMDGVDLDRPDVVATAWR